jgi:pimeloyl-ACP methyl ester carboxylesterase
MRILLSLFFIFSVMYTSSQEITSLEDHKSNLKFLQIEDGKMAYIDEGEGPVLLLLHGVPTSSYLYRKMIPLLANAGYRVIVPDAFGYGQSDKIQDYKVYSPQDQARRFHEFMEKLNIDKWTQVCHDAGSIWTWAMILQDHSKVERLILLNSIVYEEGFCPPIKPGKFMSKFISGIYQGPMFGKTLVKKTLKNGLYKFKLSKAEQEAYWRPFQTNGKYAIRNFFQSMSTYPALLLEMQKLMKEVQIPTSIIWGERDKILVAKDQIPLIMRDFNVDPLDVHLLFEQNHFIQEQAPETVVEFMLKFLSK